MLRMEREMDCTPVQKSTVCFISFNAGELWEEEGTVPYLSFHPYLYVL